MKKVLYKVLQIGVIFVLLSAGLRVLSVWAETRSGDFNGVPTNGPAPLTVQFTDESGDAPTGWAWYFGDETFAAPWSELTPSAGWGDRSHHNSVVLPDGDILVMGGSYDDSVYFNDIWRSADGGGTWSEVTVTSPDVWSARGDHVSVVLPDGGILVMGGYYYDHTYDVSVSFNDIWRSEDGGKTWTELTDSAGWAGRYSFTSVVLSDGDILVMGGFDGSVFFNDIWRSEDGGVNWTEVTETTPVWTARAGHTSVVLPDGDILVMGGFDGEFLNDIWRSEDGGVNWTEVTVITPVWTARAGHTSVVLPNGDILVMGGFGHSGYLNDVWRSADDGETWTQLDDAGWLGRCFQTSVVLPDGGVLVMGGDHYEYESDVWRLATAGSQVQNPQHIYNETGNYTVVLQAFNAESISRISKQDYIRVFSMVTFEPNGGSGTMTPQSANVPTPLTLNAFTRDGFAFSGWNTASDGSGTAYGDGATYDFAADMTLYALWEIDTYRYIFPIFFN